MKMSAENYTKLKDFFDFLVETASDEVAEYYIMCLAKATEIARDNALKMQKKMNKEKVDGKA